MSRLHSSYIEAWPPNTKWSPLLAGALVFCLLLPQASENIAGAQQPNILVILTEDQGAQVSHPAFAQFGSAGVATPNMDALINAGVGFTNGFVSTPVCSASKAAFYTGLHGHTNGIRQNTTNINGPKTLQEDQQIAQSNALYRDARIHEELPTLIEMLRDAGYYSGVTHKLHVAQNHQFPYDSWNSGDPSGSSFNNFLNQAGNQPWFYMANIKNPHQPFITDGESLDNPNSVEVPGHLPNTSTARANWAKYLSAVQAADNIVGDIMQTFDNRGLSDDTVVIFFGDHGPGLHRGKMSPHDFGLRTVMSVSGPGMRTGAIDSSLVFEIDLMPTLLDLAGVERPDLEHGKSLLPLLDAQSPALTEPFRDYVVGEVSANKTGPAGHQERSIYDGEFRLVYRHDLHANRQVNVDLWQNKNNPNANVQYATAAYREIVANSTTYKDEFEMLAQVHNWRFNSAPPQFELYQTASDTWEMNDLADSPQHRATWNRLYTALRVWAHETDDNDTPLQDLWAEGEQVVDNFTPFNVTQDATDPNPYVYVGKTGALDNDPDWKTRRFGGGADFQFSSGVVVAPAGEALATHDALFLLEGQDFEASVQAKLEGADGLGVVFGYQDPDNYFSFELLDGVRTAYGNNDLRLVQHSGGIATELLTIDGLPNAIATEFYDVQVEYDAEQLRLNLEVTDSGLNNVYFGHHTLSEALPGGTLFGINSLSGGGAAFTSFSSQTFDVTRLVGDFNGDGIRDAGDVGLITAAFGAVTPQTAIYNLATPDNVIDQADVDYWQNSLATLVDEPPPAAPPNLTLVVDPDTGEVGIVNQSSVHFTLDAYTIYSEFGGNSLDGEGWNSLQQQGLNGWRESPSITSGLVGRLSELNPLEAIRLAPGETLLLGDAFEVGTTQDLIFEFRGPDGEPLPGDFNNDWIVDLADYAIWRDGLGGEYTAADYAIWKQNYGRTAPPAVTWEGDVMYQSLSTAVAVGSSATVPEPTALAMLVLLVVPITLARTRAT